MTKSRFINPLFQRTDPAPPPAFAPQEERQEEEDAAASLEAAAPQELRSSARPAAETAPRARARAEGSPVTEEPPVKFTFYFSPAQLRQLDDLWIRAKVDHGQKVSKSEFVRLAVARLLDEFDKNPERVLSQLKRGRG